jgi:hypothetical protein
MGQGTNRRGLSRHGRILFLIFFLTLPLVNPWIRGDGVEYYAYVQSLVIDGNLNFENNWQASNPTFRRSHLDAQGQVLPAERTRTGHVLNLASVGPSLLWAPFFLTVHGAVLVVNRFGADIPANGYSRPYVIPMALVTALYGFVGLLLSFGLARGLFEERWAFLATLGIWFASSLPVYMYFNPFWSHAHSAFAVALFLWYWNRTRVERTLRQWILLGLIGGLMVDVYYPNGTVLLVPLLESLRGYWRSWRASGHGLGAAARLFLSNVSFLAAFVLAMLPTLITRQILFGNPFETGYGGLTTWNWRHPALLPVLFSSNHGLLSWTPILTAALLGLVFLRKYDWEMAVYFGAAFLGFYALMAAYPTWDGISAFGGRAFVSLTPIFIVGLAATLSELQRLFQGRRVFRAAGAAIAVLVLWNLGFIFQWGMHLIPPRGPISWRKMASNQFKVVPVRATTAFREFLFRRQNLMNHIEAIDQKQLEAQPPR